MKVDENSPEGTIVTGIVQGFDVDAGDKISYKFTGGHDEKFSIDSESGVVTVSDDSLDYELKSIYKVTTEVADLGGLTGLGLVTIYVSDVNDAPKILKISGGDALY